MLKIRNNMAEIIQTQINFLTVINMAYMPTDDRWLEMQNIILTTSQLVKYLPRKYSTFKIMLFKLYKFLKKHVKVGKRVLLLPQNTMKFCQCIQQFHMK